MEKITFRSVARYFETHQLHDKHFATAYGFEVSTPDTDNFSRLSTQVEENDDDAAIIAKLEDAFNTLPIGTITKRNTGLGVQFFVKTNGEWEKTTHQSVPHIISSRTPSQPDAPGF